MLRTTIGLSFILVLGGLAACSSKSTGDNNGSGGNGTIVGGSGSTPTTTAGTGTSAGTGQGGAASAGGGVTNTAGTTSAAGSTGACTDTTLTCVDAIQAKVCNTMTGVVETFSCVDEAKSQGFIATGCGKDADTGADVCDVTGVSDTPCLDGAQAFAHCEGATTDEQLFNIYVNCFQDFMGAHTIVPCFSEYVTPTKMTANDCLQAEEACFPSAGGAGNGAGGAP